MLARKYPYFKPEAGPDGTAVPAPLEAAVERVVRFDEVDALGIVWHGRYASYFEDARVALGDRYGIGYYEFLAAGLVVPVKQMGVDYAAPLRFKERCRITARLHWSAAARLNFSYMITNMDGAPLTTGYTVQLFCDKRGEPFVFKPDFYTAFCVRWEAGEFVASS